MNILVTAGSTRTMIDKVRCITNIFGGRTGFDIATLFSKYDNRVTLLTSNKEHVEYFQDSMIIDSKAIRFRTYDELYEQMESLITKQHWDIIIHSAAVSDYKVDKTLVSVDPCGAIYGLKEIDSDGKVASDHDTLFLKLIPTEKIIDKIRDRWGFKGKLVKFKLQVEMSDKELIAISENSRKHSGADIIVANCLEWSQDRALVLPKISDKDDLPRDKLPRRLYERIVKENVAV